MASYQLDTAREAHSHERRPSRLGRYELIGHLATGGMAEIHLARLAGEAGFEKLVVVKRLLPELVASPAYVAMFLDEGKLVARLDHPNICEVYELGRDGAEYYLAMPYLEGLAVHDLIARPREPDRNHELRVAAGVLIQACEGLHHAHELRDGHGLPVGLVHRDVSPSNLFVTASGIVKVLDFGIAKVRGAAATEVGTIKGKSQYMAPEQLLGEEVDRRCDVFALGIVAFELATHQRLFKRASEYLAARAILEEPIPRADAIDPAVPRGLADAIARALARDREQRFADARAFATAIAAGIPPASTRDIATAVMSSDELSAQRTRQASVIAQARSHIATKVVRGVSSGSRRFASRAALAGAIAVLTAAAVVAVWMIVADRDAPPTTIALPEIPAPVVPKPPPPSPPPQQLEPPPVAVVRPQPPANRPPSNPPNQPKPAPGTLSIDSTPYATIYVDGIKLGVTPIVKRMLAAGRHRIRAVVSDGRTKELVIEVPSGQPAKPIRLTW